MKTIISTLFTGLLFTALIAEAQTKRSTSINFEDDVIEGINRKNLDSVNQLSERDKQSRSHLYRKRAGFYDRDQMLAAESSEMKVK